jgi:outer membrane lipoprotein-sorting protein
MRYTLIASLMLIAAFLSGSAQQNEYPMMEKVAQKVIEKYQSTSCEDLKAQKQQPPDPQQAAMKQKVVGLLKNDPKMREQFLNKVAGPIANKMFECGMVP